MKNLIYKKFNILEIVLILSPIIDILTSVSQRTLNIDISLGLIIRSFLLFFMTMFTLIKSSYKYKKITITYLAMFILYSIFFIVNVYINKGSSCILAEAKGLIKAFYFPICIITLLNYVETKDYKIDLKLLFFVMSTSVSVNGRATVSIKFKLDGKIIFLTEYPFNLYLHSLTLSGIIKVSSFCKYDGYIKTIS